MFLGKYVQIEKLRENKTSNLPRLDLKNSIQGIDSTILANLTKGSLENFANCKGFIVNSKLKNGKPKSYLGLGTYYTLFSWETPSHMTSSPPKKKMEIVWDL